VLAQDPHIVPIPGTKRRRYLEENVEALQVTLSQAEVAAIADVVPPGVAAGNRYHEATMRMLGR
jgi:aryl-alcohol dehydrogenase-like predicted oxidoreductase